MKKFNKKKILRVAVAIISVVMLFALSAIPAAAASDGWTNAVFNSYSNILTDTTIQEKLTGYRTSDGTGMLWTLPATYPWMGDVVDFYVRANMSISLKTGDYFQIEEKTIYGWFGGQENYIISIRYILGYEFTTVNNAGQTITGIKFLRNGTWKRYEFQGGASYGLTLPREKFQITQDADNCFIGIEFKCTRDSGVANEFTINNFNFHYGYGNPNSPEAPTFKPFDDDTLNELEDAENEVLDGTQGGLDAFKNSVTGVYGLLPNYFKPLTAAVSMLNVYLGIRTLGDLINISLVFGVMGFLLSGSLVAYASRAARSDNAKHGKAGK